MKWAEYLEEVDTKGFDKTEIPFLDFVERGNPYVANGTTIENKSNHVNIGPINKSNLNLKIVE